MPIVADGVVAAGVVGEAGQLTALRSAARQSPTGAVREAARQFESLFTKMLLQSMREASLGDGLGDSEQTRFYQDMFDQQLAVQLSQGEGLGLGSRLTEQLLRSGMVPGAGASAGAGTSAGADADGQGAIAPTAATGSSDRLSGATSRQAVGIDRQREFVAGLAPAADRLAARLGVPSDAIIAQAALETGWGQHQPGGAGVSNNLFGIKAGAQWSGARAQAITTEYTGGAATRVQQDFRQYASPADSLRDYGDLLGGLPRYRDALHSGGDITRFAQALQRAGYATDPDYVQKLVATADSVRQLRSQAGSSGGSVLPTTVTSHG